MEPVSVREIISAVDGVMLNRFTDIDRCIRDVVIDSRKAEEGSLFIPLLGDRFDGHDYLDAALEQGAQGVLTAQEPVSYRVDKFYIRVEDTKVAMGKLAEYYRGKFDIPFIAVTGSVGKTTTKDMIASVLSMRYRVLKTDGNFNNNIGVPMTLFKLTREHEAAVVEMGMNHFGEIRSLARMVRPDIAIITNIGDSHIEFLGSRENILKSKCEIFEYMRPGGTVILNADDAQLRTLAGTLPYPILWCGAAEEADVCAKDIVSDGTAGILCRMDSPFMKGELDIPSPGRHMIYPAAMAITAGGCLGLSEAEMRRGVAAFCPTNMRMNILTLDKKITVLNDCYNANPQSMLAAVEILALSDRNEKIAVLGDMGELGSLAPKAHYEIGQALGRLKIDRLFAIGTLARHIRDGAVASGVSDVRYFGTKEEASPAIAAALSGDAAILVKASHMMHFEEITAMIEKCVGR